MPCPHAAKVRDDLPPLTERIAALPVDERGYPIPFFVAYVDGKPEFRAMDAAKWLRCYREKLCWVCGQKLGVHLTFAIGPMCAINRTTSEPPSHYECAEWSVRGCPFLSRPNMVRRENGMPEETESAGMAIKRNPGVTLLWTTRDYTVFYDNNRMPLISIGDPARVEWYREGRVATRLEVLESIQSGIPLLLEACELEPTSEGKMHAVLELAARAEAAMKLIPSA